MMTLADTRYGQRIIQTIGVVMGLLGGILSPMKDTRETELNRETL